MAPIFHILSIAFVVASCLTPQKRKEMESEIFALKTRVMELENSLGAGGKTIKTADESNKKNLASVNADVERQKIEIQKISGEMDRLRVGVVTGELPGGDPDQESIAKTLNSIVTRIEAVESNQNEILAALKKAGANTPGKKKAKITTLKSLKIAFDKKKYSQVVENGPAVVKKMKTRKSRESALYILAESLYKLGKMREAALKYNEFIDVNPGSKMVSHAKMRMGDCFRHLGDAATARLYYQELVDKYPKTDQATKAQARLKELGNKGKASKRSVKKNRRYSSYKPKPIKRKSKNSRSKKNKRG